MFRLDDNFLKEVGVANLPDDQKRTLLQHIYQELQERVGERLGDGLNDQQMDEFDAILQRDEAKVRQWLQDHQPDYVQQSDFQNFMRSAQQDPNAADIATLAEYVATKWLESNRPDYREVVGAVLEEIKQEIVKNRDALLAA